MSRPLEPVEDFTNEPGKGIHCTIGGHRVHIGNRKSLETNKIEQRPGTTDAMEYLENRGQTAVVVSIDDKSEAVIGLIDKAKDEAALAVNVLQKLMGIKVYMLTGDNFRTAKSVAAEIGIYPSHVVADVLPEGKVECIKRLQQENKGAIAMVGDGVNDSPSLAQADIGIAVGAGTNVAIETAGIVLVNSKLTDVAVAVQLSQTIYKRIKLNFVWALGYNSAAIPIAAGALYPVVGQALPPFIAGIAMVLSSMTVLFSSLLLNQYKPPIFDKEYKSKDGEVNLDKVHVTLTSGNRVTVQCESMRAGGPCCCDPDSCGCDDCEEHNPKDSTSLIPRSMDQNWYPGCPSSWGKACTCRPGNCSCGENCQCCNTAESTSSESHGA